MFSRKLILFAIILLVLPACLAGPSAQDLAKTMVAQTVVAAPPTDTPAPLPTDTQLPPTVAATATASLTPTQSGPLVIKDDFSTKSGIWGPCTHCEWKDNKLYFGPFPPNGDKVIDQLHYLVCVACGQHTYYHVSADVAFASGEAGDRFYGIGAVTPDKYLAAVGITPYQYGILEILDLTNGRYLGSKIARYGAIKAGGATNHIELDARPDPSGTVDYYAIVNGKTILFVTNQTAGPTQAALYFDWHSVGVTVDNFEFDEIVP